MEIKRLVILESPYAGNLSDNLCYGRAAIRDCLLRGESPIASHLLYTQDGVLRDRVASERALGIKAGLSWLRVADASIVYTDLGISKGMQEGIEAAKLLGKPIEFRTIPNWRQTCKTKQ